jgi:alpha-1,2-mannosyltransferase
VSHHQLRVAPGQLRDPAPATGPRWSSASWRRAALLAVAAWAGVIAVISRIGMTHSLDLLVYRQAASNMLHGGATYTSTFADHLYFTYPPFALLVFSPLATLSMHTAVWVWDLCNVLALAVALSVLVRRCVSVSRTHAAVLGALVAAMSCLLFEPLRNSLLNGQVNLVLICAVVLDVFVVPPRARGLLIGLAAAIKLTPLVFVLYLLIAKEHRAAARAVAGFAVATAVAWLVLPHDSATFWLHQAFSPAHKGGTMSDWNQSWWGFVGRLPASDGSVRTAVWLAASAATLGVGIYVARCYVARGRRVDALFVIAVTGLLVSPVSWTHHWSWVAVIPVLLLARNGRHRAVTIAMVVLLVLTIPSPYGWHLRGAWPLNFSLAIVAAGLLVVMATVEWRASRHTDGALDQGPLDAAEVHAYAGPRAGD